MLILRRPDTAEFQAICAHIGEYELDDRSLHADQFTAAFREGELVGFGRLRRHSGCEELCSLGVITLVRRQGIGSAIVQQLIQRASQDLYLVCIIPSFFVPFGFRVTEVYPSALLDKLHYCTQQLIVPETYVAMKFFV